MEEWALEHPTLVLILVMWVSFWFSQFRLVTVNQK